MESTLKNDGAQHLGEHEQKTREKVYLRSHLFHNYMYGQSETEYMYMIHCT